MTYLENHREMLDYLAVRRRGLPIASGNTAATCKTLFTVRMKRSGARWKKATAADVINLRELALSDSLAPGLSAHARTTPESGPGGGVITMRGRRQLRVLPKFSAIRTS